MSIRVLLNAAALAALIPMAAQAAPLTYDVNRAIGLGSVVGTITTDGTIGVLNDGNITGWSLTLNNGISSFLLSSLPLNSQHLIGGSALSADADSIDFDFLAASGYLIFQNPVIGSGINFWCVELGGCSSFGGPSESVQVGATGVFAARSGLVSIATISSSNVPEPTTLALTGLALLGLAAARLRRA